MYEGHEEPEDFPPLPAGDQTETGGLSLAKPSIPRPQKSTCRSPGDSVISRSRRLNWHNPYSSSLLGYSVHATRDLARSRLAIIAWPTGLSGDSQVSGRNMPTAVSSTRGCHLTAGQAGTTQDRR
ncbi:hypothetical protein RF11_01150 [Thelohanellus kitauei]|uniref:Uncharacterized protein n=1 Tax=Thelohanellus kitauei TaxID=669202 RepID=A0A0C2MJ10_THEKT|nr:hypothetical protein RF11_01150 [Thelohanellus kitauei]